MKIFLSWSGDRSQQMAQAIHEWLPLVLHFCEPWISNSDIEAGERWANEVAKELETSNFGVICITKDNISSPWILFEAGALAKFMLEGKVVPLLLDIDFKDISGPLTQFQSKKFSKQGIYEIIKSINRLAQTPVADERLSRLFETLWPQLQEKIESIPQSETKQKNRSQNEVLEELVSGIRGIELKLRDFTDDKIQPKRSKSYGEIDYILSVSTKSVNIQSKDNLLMLVISSLLRENFPWVYDLCYDLYKEKLINGQSDAYYKIKSSLVESIKLITSSHLADLFTGNSKQNRMSVTFLENYLYNIDMIEIIDKNPITATNKRENKDKKDYRFHTMI